MEPHQKETMKRTRRHSKSLLQDLLYKGIHAGDRDTPVPGRLGRDAKTIQTIASVINGKSKLLLLESPDTVEVYKLDKQVVDLGDGGGGRSSGHVYLPPISAKASNLGSMRGALSQSCPYLSSKRRASLSSVGSQRAAHYGKTQSSLTGLKEGKRSNVTVTMVYLGQGRHSSASVPDELKVLQQICGGENICVFRGLVKAGEQFQFTSRRHRGYPFSATLYVNGLVAARISSCCEYRYAPGFQQGAKSCFRLVWLAGGIPCYRCTSLRNKYSSCQQLSHRPTENLSLPQDPNPGTVEGRASSPLFVPVKPEKAATRRRRRRKTAFKTEGTGRSTDSEDPAGAGVQENRKPKRRKAPSGQREDSKDPEGSQKLRATRESEEDPESSAQQQQSQQKKPGKAKNPRKDHQESNNTAKVPDSLQAEEALSKQIAKEKKDPGSNGKSRNGERLRDFYEECVEMSAGLELGPNKQSRFKASSESETATQEKRARTTLEYLLERRRLQKRLSSGPVGEGSDPEASEESDDALHPDGPAEEPTTAVVAKHVPVREQDLQTKLDAMMTVLNTSDEVEQLVLRNTGLTDDLLLTLAHGLKGSLSEVALLNLNLNRIGPYGAAILLDLLWAKPQVRGLLLFGNQLGDSGVLTLLTGLVELQAQEMTMQQAAATAAADPLDQNAVPHPALTSLPDPPCQFALLELDIGGNGLGSEGLLVLASYLRHYSQLQYLGLAQTGGADVEAWGELFESLKGNATLGHIILDESGLGDRGVRLFAEMLIVNRGLRKVDLDWNGVSEVGGGDILTALLYRAEFPLWHLSLEGNHLSTELILRIQQEVRYS